jgi:hypothetical protein
MSVDRPKRDQIFSARADAAGVRVTGEIDMRPVSDVTSALGGAATEGAAADAVLQRGGTHLGAVTSSIWLMSDDRRDDVDDDICLLVARRG